MNGLKTSPRHSWRPSTTINDVMVQLVEMAIRAAHWPEGRSHSGRSPAKTGTWPPVL
jgi:hypothetical protein